MIPGLWLDIATVLAAACALSAAGIAWRRPDPSPALAALLAAATAIPAALLAFLATRFLATDLSYQYVFFYTGTEVDWPYRLAGTWAGREGSLLLWTVLLGATTAFVGLRRGVDAARMRTTAILSLLLALFLLAVAQQSPFAATAPALLEGRPTGNGLNPTLASPFMLIHPPMMFAAYAASAVPFAAAFASFAGADASWSRTSATASRVGWLLMTFALGLGSIWAYYTLGFGGYWAWDPVEVANLLPWLAFALFLHARLRHERTGAFANVGPLLAVLPFLLTLFSTISTRSGLWVSVHAFTDPTDTFNPDAAARFLDILAVEPTLGFHVGLFLAGTAAFLAAWCIVLARGRWRRGSAWIATPLALLAAYALLWPRSATSALMEVGHLATGSAGLGLLVLAAVAFLAAASPWLFAGDKAERRIRLDLASLAAYAVLALGLALLVLFLLHVAASQQGSLEAFYEERLPFLALPVILGVLLFQTHKTLGKRRSLLVAAMLAAFAVAVYLAARQAGAYRVGQGFLLGIPAAALVLAGLHRTWTALSHGPLRKRTADGLLLGAAVLNVLFWLNPPTVRLGTWTWTPVWPAQAVVGGLALFALWATARYVAGAPKHKGIHVLVGGLGAFYVAPAMAFAAWMLRAERAESDASRRLHQAAVHTIHLALAIALLGYAASTYFQQEEQMELAVHDRAAVGDMVLRFEGTRTPGTAGLPAEHLGQLFVVERDGVPDEPLVADLVWQARAGAHLPTPATLRTWSTDLYLDVQAIHVAAGSACLPPGSEGAWIEAYRPPTRICAGDTVDLVRARAATLPGLGLLWLALALGVGAMVQLVLPRRRLNPEEPSQA